MRLLLLLLFLGIAQAQTFQVTEISPQKVGETEEWFEFRVESEEPIDFSQYQVSNGKNLPKPLDTVLVGTDDGYFYFTKSPVSLANDGGIIQILDNEEQVIHEVVYPKTKAGTTKNYKWAEVWNWSDEYQEFLPLIYRNDNNLSYRHTAGKINQKLPTPADKFKTLFSEASPDWKKDGYEFLEFYVKDGPDEINLKYTEFKHNGTALWYFENDFIVSPEEFILLYLGTATSAITKTSNPYEIWSNKRDGLSGGSGTVEVINFSGTSRENLMDAVCWQDEKLSKTEQKRIDKYRVSGDWIGDCYEIGDNIDNESIARSEGFRDSNTESDLWHHYNGSPGTKNIPTNQPPVAVIEVQGSQRTIGHPPFSLNVTGESSHDPDGGKDLKTYQWYLNDQLFSELENPPNFKIEKIAHHILKLIVTDHSGAVSEATQDIFVTERISAPSASNSLEFKAHLAATIASSSSKKSTNDTLEDDFFAPILSNETFMQTLYKNQLPQPIYPDYETEMEESAVELEAFISPRKIVLPKIVRERLSRNLGLIWSWRQARWAAGVGSTSDGAIDQNSERFAVMFGVP